MAVPKRKNLAVTARHAPFGRRAQAADLRRGQGFGELRRPHHVDLKTGMYRGRQILKSKKDV